MFPHTCLKLSTFLRFTTRVSCRWQSTSPSSTTSPIRKLGPGLATSGAVLLGATQLAPIIGLPLVPIAIVGGVTVGALLSPAQQNIIKPGAAFAGTMLLRAGVVCVGLKLSLVTAATCLQMSLPVVLPTLAAVMVSTIALARALRLDAQFAVLMAAGTGICGVTAISTVAPAIQAAEQWFAVSVANVILFGMLGMLLYPLLAHYLFFEKDDREKGGLSPSTKAGLLLGVCIHDSSQVLGAAMSFRDSYNDDEAFNVATVTKLTRNALLVLVVPILSVVYYRYSISLYILEDKESNSQLKEWSRRAS